ncbi:hypothetical protein GGI17_005616, partial [Coemansia sp. S146]
QCQPKSLARPTTDRTLLSIQISTRPRQTLRCLQPSANSALLVTAFTTTMMRIS